MLRKAGKQEKYTTIVDIVRNLALTGCRRSETIGLKWTEVDTEASCLWLEDSKEGESIRLIGLPVVDIDCRHRKRHQTARDRADLQSAVHDQTKWHGNGPVYLSLYRRVPRWTLVGLPKLASGRCLSNGPARKHVSIGLMEERSRA
jgi:integrase